MEVTAIGTAVSPPVSKPASTTRTESLDTLAALDSDALEARYRAAPEPTSVSRLEGHPTGRMLAIRRLDHGPLTAPLRAFAASVSFPWGGKSFTGQGAEGRGINRVHLAGRHQVFPFLTLLGSSAIDGRRSVILDYDLPDNPSLIRAIHDEVREVDDGLFLGPAMWKRARSKELILWFSLDTHLPARPIGERIAHEKGRA